jgi:hypothetical protein
MLHIGRCNNALFPGYSIFVIRGSPPRCKADDVVALQLGEYDPAIAGKTKSIGKGYTLGTNTSDNAAKEGDSVRTIPFHCASTSTYSLESVEEMRRKRLARLGLK